MDFYNRLNFEQLTSEFAHEVKNPVSLIQANIDYIQTSDTSGIYEKNYGIIRKELQKIINVVKDFGKIMSPVQTDEREVIFIYDLISDIIDEFSTPYENKKINFNLNCFDEEIKIFGEYSKICIIFFNVFKNAIEAIKDEGIIDVFVRKENSDILIKVTDNGEGITKNNEALIHEPFFTTKENGTGLGIPICRRIAESHGGSFDIYNNKDNTKGCTVEIIFKESLM